VLSRVADAIYWMNRYVERAENVARFVDVSLHLSLDVSSDAGQWGALVATTGDDGAFRARFGEPDRDKVLEFLTFDRDNPSSIYSSLRAARDNARSVREIVSSEMWEQLNKAYLMVSDAARAKDLGAPHAFFTAVKHAAALFVGLTYVTMTHNEAWHFGRLGRLLERADKTSRILDVKYFLLAAPPGDRIDSKGENAGALPARPPIATLDETQWAALLKSASAFEMYRKRHGLIAPHKVVDFLMLERKFPRSILYCLTKAERSLHAITGTPLGASSDDGAERALGKLHAEFEFAVTQEILDRGLHEYLDGFQTRLNTVGEAIRTSFFAPVSAAPPEDQESQQQ
jgi:uncharacterized alpha-E superfamily protein